MVYRVYVEKRPGLTAEADALANDIRTLLRIDSLESLRLYNRYDVENITPELFQHSVRTILSEPQLDTVSDTLPEGGVIFAQEGIEHEAQLGGQGGDELYVMNAFLRTEGGRSYVYVLGADGKLEQRDVRLGKGLWGEYTQILGGLSPDDYVAFPYGKDVRPGAKVTINEDLEALYQGMYY